MNNTGPLGKVHDRVTELLHGVPSDTSAVSLSEIETALLRRAVEHSGGNLSAAARLLGLRRAQLAYRLKSRGITV